MRLECAFAPGAYSADDRDRMADSIDGARRRLVGWLVASGLDPERLACREQVTLFVMQAGPPSHVDHRAGRMHLVWPPDRPPGLVHEWTHVYSPPPAGTPEESFLREGIAVHLEDRLGTKPAFPFGRASVAEVAAWYAPATRPGIAYLDRAGRALGGWGLDPTPHETDRLAARFLAYAWAGLTVAHLIEDAGLSPAILFEEALGRADAGSCVARALGRPMAESTAAIRLPARGASPPDVLPGSRAWFERWREISWGDPDPERLV